MHFREDDLPVRIRALRMPCWAGVALGAGLLVLAVAAITGSILVNARDSTVVPAWSGMPIMAGAVISAVFGAVLIWYAGVWVTLTRDAAFVTTGFLTRARVDRTQLEDFHAYRQRSAWRRGVQYRMVPTFTFRDPFGRLCDLPLPFLAYWSPAGGTGAALPPRAAHIETWARGASSPYSRMVFTGAVPATLLVHRQALRTGLLRRARVVAILIPTVSLGLAIALGLGFEPVSKVLAGQTRSFDAQTDRTGVRDLDDSLTPAVTGYQWRSQQFKPGTRNLTFFPTMRLLPSAPYTVRYFIRDPGQHGTDLSIPEQKYGRIISAGTISVSNPTIEFSLDHDATIFTFEVYVTDAHGHTTFNSVLYRNIAANPAATPTP